jgi:uncharacterized glyoxalase superfamily protein PhnB
MTDQQQEAAARTVSSEVTVPIDPATAFRVFTEEIDLWWVRGPINFYDASRAVAMRCEPGIGGRLLEVYDDEAGDALELGQITTWQPGSLLGWQSSVDDVAVEVSFTAAGLGTRVCVQASIPAGGEDRGGTAWVRVVPDWLGGWVAKRDTAGREPSDLARLAIAVYYARPATAARWLADAFGFSPTSQLPAAEADQDSGDYTWIEFQPGGCSVLLFKLTGENARPAARTHVPWIFVDDLDAQLALAEKHDVRIVSDIEQHGYRKFVAADLEGNHWTFVQARPTMR